MAYPIEVNELGQVYSKRMPSFSCLSGQDHRGTALQNDSSDVKPSRSILSLESLDPNHGLNETWLNFGVNSCSNY